MPPSPMADVDVPPFEEKSDDKKSRAGPFEVLGPKILLLYSIGLAASGVLMIIVAATATNYGIYGLTWALVLTGFVSLVAGGLGILASSKSWWSVVLLLSILQAWLVFACLIIAVVCYMWTSEAKSPISEAVDDHWNRGLRVSLETDVGDNRKGFCDPHNANSGTPKDGSCFAFYRQIEDEDCKKHELIHTCNISASDCSASGLLCRACDMECRHAFEDTLHDTIQGTAWMGILFLFGATVMTFWAWYVALLDTRDISSAGREEQLKEAAMNVNVAVRGGKIAHMDAGLEVRKLEEHMDKLRQEAYIDHCDPTPAHRLQQRFAHNAAQQTCYRIRFPKDRPPAARQRPQQSAPR